MAATARTIHYLDGSVSEGAQNTLGIHVRLRLVLLHLPRYLPRSMWRSHVGETIGVPYHHAVVVAQHVRMIDLPTLVVVVAQHLRWCMHVLGSYASLRMVSVHLTGSRSLALLNLEMIGATSVSLRIDRGIHLVATAANSCVDGANMTVALPMLLLWS